MQILLLFNSRSVEVQLDEVLYVQVFPKNDLKSEPEIQIMQECKAKNYFDKY